MSEPIPEVIPEVVPEVVPEAESVGSHRAPEAVPEPEPTPEDHADVEAAEQSLAEPGENITLAQLHDELDPTEPATQEEEEVAPDEAYDPKTIGTGATGAPFVEDGEPVEETAFQA